MIDRLKKSIGPHMDEWAGTGGGSRRPARWRSLRATAWRWAISRYGSHAWCRVCARGPVPKVLCKLAASTHAGRWLAVCSTPSCSYIISCGASSMGLEWFATDSCVRRMLVLLSSIGTAPCPVEVAVAANDRCIYFGAFCCSFFGCVVKLGCFICVHRCAQERI